MKRLSFRNSSEASLWNDVIAASFPEVEIIVEHTNGIDLDQDRYAKLFDGKTWNRIPTKTITGSTAALSTLSPDAVSLLLPAFLLAAVNSYDVAWALLLTLDPDHSPRAQAIARQLNCQQRTITMRILEISCEGVEDEEAIERVRSLMNST